MIGNVFSFHNDSEKISYFIKTAIQNALIMYIVYSRLRILELKEVKIVISLLEECNDVNNYDIEDEIRKELTQQLSMIPWAKEIKSVTVK